MALRIRLVTALLSAATLSLAACGEGDGSSEEDRAQPTAGAQGADLAAIRGYLLEHTERLVADTGEIRAGAEEYYALAKSADFDYGRMLEDKREDVRRLVKEAQAGFTKANPSYEEMEGVVAGVPSLAEYDVIIDAGGDASEPDSAVPFDIKTPSGRTLKQPGNFNYLIETTAFGTEPKFAAPDVSPTSTATAASSSARRCPTPASTSPPRASSTRRPASSPRPPRAGSRRSRTRSPRSWS